VGCCRGPAWDPSGFAARAGLKMARLLQGCGVGSPGTDGGPGFGPHSAPAWPVWAWLSGAAGTQEMAANPRTEIEHSGTKIGAIGGLPPPPVSTDPAPRVAHRGPRACSRAGTGNRTTDSRSRENGCRDSPKPLSRLHPHSPRPPSATFAPSSVGRGSCLVSFLNPASV